jgi:CubicO group peptidase (beta-lactamase class C family)
MKRLLLMSLMLWLLTPSFAQVVVKGRLLSEADESPIPFVNIGILNSGIGTISNSDGSFTIKVPLSHINDNLQFSAIGYATKTIAVKAIIPNEPLLIYLKEKIIFLDEVVISSTPENEKHAWLGNGKRHLMVQGQMYIDSISAGGAMALLIEKKDLEDLNFINQARLFITRNTEPEFKVRVRMLEVDHSNGDLPGADLFNESVVVVSDIRRGWLTFDLSSYDISIDEESFYLVFEWILEDHDRLRLFNKLADYGKLHPNELIRVTVVVDGKKMPTAEYSSRAPIPVIAFGDTRTKSDLEKYTCYSRGNSFGEWKRGTSIISAKILMSNQPSENLSSTIDNYETMLENKDSSHLETLHSKIRKWGDNFIENYSIPGMQLAVSTKDSTLFSGGFGDSDIENSIKVNTKTRFRIASVSKPITATAIMKLASEGKIDLDTNIRTYVPSFPEKKHALTTRQLAGHLGGIRDYFEISTDELFNNPHFESATAAISIFKNDTLMSTPGSQFLYSSFGYDLLGAVIESASGENYLDYMQRNIWKPLSMENTYGDIADSTIINTSKFYLPNEEEANPYDLSYGHPSGGLISTADDLLKFGNESLFGSFLNADFKKMSFKTQYADQNPTNYGLGWYIGKDINEQRIWYHTGELPSSGAVIILYPDSGIAIALLTNTPILTNAPDGLPMEVQKLGELIYQK